MELSSFANRVQTLVRELVRNCELCDRLCLAQYGITASQGYTLLALPREGSMSMNELSEAMGLASSTMTRMVDQLVSKRLVHREPSEEDRRVVCVELTTQGRELQRTLAQVMENLFSQALAAIPQDERTAILGALERINQAVADAVTVCSIT